MNKSEIVEILKGLDDNLQEPEELFIGGGSALVLMDVRRQARDIDLLEWPSWRFQDVIDEYLSSHGHPRDLINSDASVFEFDRGDCVWFGRRLVVFTPTLEAILRSKATSQRVKDWEDIAWICKHLGWNENHLKEVQGDNGNMIYHVSYVLNHIV